MGLNIIDEDDIWCSISLPLLVAMASDTNGSEMYKLYWNVKKKKTQRRYPFALILGVYQKAAIIQQGVILQSWGCKLFNFREKKSLADIWFFSVIVLRLSNELNMWYQR